MTTFTIRDAIDKDILGLYEVFSETEHLHLQAHPEVFRLEPQGTSSKNYYRSCIIEPNSAIFVAETNQKIVGALICSIQFAQKNPILIHRKFCLIENISVLSEYRESGVGNALMARTQQWAKAMGATSIELTVWEFNQGAIEFYKKNGYQTIHHKMRKGLQ